MTWNFATCRLISTRRTGARVVPMVFRTHIWTHRTRLSPVSGKLRLVAVLVLASAIAWSELSGSQSSVPGHNGAGGPYRRCGGGHLLTGRADPRFVRLGLHRPALGR